MASKFKESELKKEVLDGDHYFTYPRELEEGEKDYSGLVLGDFRVDEPIMIDDFHSFFPFPGWICFNLKTNVYKIMPKLALGRIYVKYMSDKKYLGLEYVSSDFSYTKLNLQQFKADFLKAVESEYVKRNDEYSKEQYNEYKDDLKLYVQNVAFNLKTLKALNRIDFEEELSKIINKYHFIEIKDISSYKNCLYLAVIDEYNQFYVGKCVNGLKNRMRKHWTAKINPARHLWNGGFEASRIKYDDFKMFDTTRIFVCEDINTIIEENEDEANDTRLEVNNTFGFDKFEEMDELAKAERIVINNSKCRFCLSDRTPLMNCPRYNKLEKIYGISRNDMLIKQYIRLDTPEPYIAWQELNEK